MEHLLQKSKCSIFHNIFRYVIFQRHQKAFLWSKLSIVENKDSDLYHGRCPGWCESSMVAHGPTCWFHHAQTGMDILSV